MMDDREAIKPQQGPDGGFAEEVSDQPAKLLRIGATVREMLEEVRRAPLDEGGRRRLREMHEISVRELKEILSEELCRELDEITIPFDTDAPSEPELRVAQAQLRGWLEGLFHGIQAALWTQQLQAQSQLGRLQRGQAGPQGEPKPGERSGQYL